MLGFASLALGLILSSCQGGRGKPGDDSGSETGDSGSPDLSDLDPIVDTQDLVIVGGGASGLATAYAAGHGLLIEAEPTLGGRAALNSNLEVCLGCPELAEEEIEDSLENAVAEWPDITGGEATAVTEAFLEDAAEVHEVLRGLSLNFTAWGKSTTRGTQRLTVSTDLIGAAPQALADALSSDVEVWTSTPVRSLVIRGGAVYGVMVDDGYVPADHVVIATGGYTANASILEEIAGEPDGSWSSSGGPSAAGDAVGWARDEDLGVSHLDAVGWYYGSMANSADGQPIGVTFDPDGLHPWIWVAEDGRRFANETWVWSLVASTAIHEHAVVWAVSPRPQLEEALGSSVPIFQNLLDAGEHTFCAADAASLADLVDLDPTALAATLADVQSIIDGDLADPWQRPPGGFPDFSTGEICAWKPGRIAMKSYGGLAVDDQGRVLDASGSVVPGLYAVGEAAGMGQPAMGGQYGFDGSMGAVVWSGLRVGTALQ